MAGMLRDILGELLLTEPISGVDGVLPSPNQLRGWIVVKGKTSAFRDEDEAISPRVSSPRDIRKDSKVEDSPHTPSPKLTPRSSIAHLKQLFNGGEEVPKPKKKEAISPVLAETVVYLKGKSSKGMETLVDVLEYDQMYSLNDRKAFQFLQKQKDLYMSMTRQKMCRVYPSMIRVTSSNFDPLPLWLAGTQMAALNFQTFDKAMELNTALFDSNGGCGYALKPNFLRDLSPKPPRTVTMTIISGQQIKKGGSVVVEVLGNESDCIRFRTENKKSSSGNPLWKFPLKCTILYPEFAFFRFEVFEESGSLVGTFTIALECMQQGYRHVPLNNKNGDRVGFSTIFVHVSIE
jgi:phosphatidylinositol phospholipase C delta